MELGCPFGLDPFVMLSVTSPMTIQATQITRRITPFLWYDGRAEEAAEFYIGIFENSKILSRSPMSVHFELSGQPFIALNGGPMFQFTEAISFFVECENQAEVDKYWAALVDGGTPLQCGWLKDKFGLTWQVVPTALMDFLQADDKEKWQRVMDAMMPMLKLDIQTLKNAFDGV